MDDARPYYNVYGGLQDNQAWGAPNQTRKTFGTSNADWFRLAGGDGFYSVADPSDHNFVYSESQNGNIGRYDARTGTDEGHHGPSRNRARTIATTGARRSFRHGT